MLTTWYARYLSGLAPASLGRVRFDFGKAFWLWGNLLIGLCFGIPNYRLDLVILALVLTLLTLCLGHSVGLHRGVIHEAFQMGPMTRRILVYLAMMTGLGGPLSWVQMHGVRDYWQSRGDCPRFFAYRHRLLTDFFWNLHLRFEPCDDRAEARLPKEARTDPWLQFLEKSWPLHFLFWAALCHVWLGPAAVAICFCARAAGGLLGHWAIGYASHAFGEQPFKLHEASESGTNNWLLGVLSFGEGFHNNHHSFPYSARMGLRPWDIDLGWYAVLVLDKLGLIKAIRLAP